MMLGGDKAHRSGLQFHHLRDRQLRDRQEAARSETVANISLKRHGLSIMITLIAQPSLWNEKKCKMDDERRCLDSRALQKMSPISALKREAIDCTDRQEEERSRSARRSSILISKC